jgi:activator of HSP90 ATPase
MRRRTIIGLATLPVALALHEAAGSAVTQNQVPAASEVDKRTGISRLSESIHQEISFKADRRRVYEALTEQERFDKIVRLSAAMKSGQISSAVTTQLSRDLGGAFSLFGGYITGRHLELVPDERIVQAWRSGSWSPGDYSIVKISLSDEGAGSRLVLDHRGFPDGQAAHLAEGWYLNYWRPLGEYLD